MTIIWAVLIGAAVSYVLTSMAGEPFVMSDSLILSAILAVVAIILGDGILRESN